MIDCDISGSLTEQLGIADNTRRGTTEVADEHGKVHLVLFGHYKELLPATSQHGRRAPENHNSQRCETRNETAILSGVKARNEIAVLSGVKIPEGFRGKAPFISIPRVYQNFDFRVLRQNRRIVSDESRRDELEDFHQAGARVAHDPLLAHTMGA